MTPCPDCRGTAYRSVTRDDGVAQSTLCSCEAARPMREAITKARARSARAAAKRAKAKDARITAWVQRSRKAAAAAPPVREAAPHWQEERP